MRIFDLGICRYADPLSDVLGRAAVGDRSRPHTARAERRDVVAHAHRHPVADELRHLQEIEEEGQSPATQVIMAGSVWIVAAVIVLLVTAAVYLAVRLGL